MVRILQGSPLVCRVIMKPNLKMNTLSISAALCAIGMAIAAQDMNAQTYEQAPVTVSKEKVRGSDGKLYWSHVVLERQTLFSIAKAYGVTVDDICKANQELDLKTNGLKKNSIILIPVTSAQQPASAAAQVGKANDSAPKKKDDYTIHVAKWYEDMDDIAYKYSIPKEILMEYNGLSSTKLKSRQKIRIPSQEKVNEIIAGRKTSANTPHDEHVTPITATAPKETEQSQSRRQENWGQKTARSQVNAIVMLPMKASTSAPSESNLDFYSGVLMAVKDLGKEGIDTDLSVYDVPGTTLPVTSDRLKASDFSIGPVSKDAVARTLALAPDATYVISPLDHRTASLVQEHRNMIQAPASQGTQYRDLLKWIKSETRSGDKVLVISEKGAAATSAISLMNEVIADASISCARYSYNILEGRNAANAISTIMTKTGTNRVIINSESEAFVNDAVRNLDMLVYRKYNVVLYSPSKIRSFETIDVENLHNLKTRISTAYYIDYDSPAVRRFLLEYRALYNTEPTQFSFQGYDLAYFFIKMKATYGNGWMDKVSKMANTPMMQTDFLFREAGNGGYVNDGVRRIVYEPDYRIRIVKK